MANPTWFDAAHYKAQKLAQLQATDSNGGWTAAKLDTVLTEAGFGGAEGAYAHFSQYGSLEHCSPNAAFNGAEYLAGKLAQLQKVDSAWLSLGLSDVQAALAKAGLGEWDHYQLYGSQEGINASNSFDDNAYLTAKLAQLVATDAAHWTGKNIVDVREALSANGLSPMAHYLAYGKGEGLTATAVAPENQVTVPADFYIFGGKGGMPSTGFELTRGADNLTGTAGNDSFFAANANGFQTLNANDSLNGGAGDDTLYIGAGAGVENFAKASIKSIEHVVNVAAGTLDVSANADVKDVVTNGSVTAKLAQGVALKDGGNSDGTTANAVTVKFVDATGSADAVTMKMDSNNIAGLNVEGVEKLTLNVTGRNAEYGDDPTKDTAMTFSDKTLQELVVSGDGSLKIDGTVGSNGSVSKMDLLAAGGVEVSMAASALAKEVTVTGGAGDDLFAVDDTTAKNKITLNLGDGDNTVAVDTAVHKDSVFTVGSGNDTLMLADFAANTEEIGKQFIGFDEVVLYGESVFNNEHFKGIDKGTVHAHSGDSTTVTGLNEIVLTDGDDTSLDLLSVGITAGSTLELTLDNMSATAAAGITADILGTNAGKLLIHSEGNANTDNTISDLKLANGVTANDTITKITLDGSQAFLLDLGSASAVEKVDASALTGDFTLDASSAAIATSLEMIGGKGENDITGRTTLLDKINIEASKGEQDTINLHKVLTEAGQDTILGFDAGNDGDVLIVGGLGTVGTTTNHKGAATFTEITSTVALKVASAISTATFSEYSKDIGIKAASAAGVVEALTGIVGTTLADNNVGYLVVYGGDDAYLYYIDGTGTSSGKLDAGDLKLVGVLEDVADGALTGANFDVVTA